MTRLVVATDTRLMTIGDGVVRCSIGRGGACDADEKREGDGCTPRGTWPIRSVLVRPDRAIEPPRYLPWRWLRPDDGWSDDVRDPNYNRPARHPYDYSAERLWRADHLYDVIVILGHNDQPPIAPAGSAIFLHLREADSTDGCVAIELEPMQKLLAVVGPSDNLMIR